MKTKLIVFSFIGMLLLLSSCGPSAQEVATMTASAWTPTPPPTATPIPSELNLKVTDENGAGIAGASVILPESGSDSPLQADDSGQVSWKNLPPSSVLLKVSAPGYSSADLPATLQSGPNDVTVSLKAEAFGLKAVDACLPGEILVYIEDFQDGKAQGWQNITGAAEFGAKNGWMLGPTEPGNNAAYFTGVYHDLDILQDLTIENAVWRLNGMTMGTDGFSFLNLKFVPAPEGGTRYIVQWGATPQLDLTRLQNPGPGSFSVGRSDFRATQGQWHYFELSVYQGQVQVWVDGKKEIEYQDPQPIGAGMISLEVNIPKDPNTIYAFDNLSVCELKAPLANSLYKPPTP